jgi:hypothetical protein
MLSLVCGGLQSFSTRNYFNGVAIPMGDFTKLQYLRYDVGSPEFRDCNALYDISHGMVDVYNLTRQYAFLNRRTGEHVVSL